MRTHSGSFVSYATFAALAAGLAGAPRIAAASSIGVEHTTAAGIPVLTLTVDLHDRQVKVTGVVAQAGCGHDEKFEDMIHRTHPTAAVTGTFFCVRSLQPIGDIVVNGHLVHRGGVGTALCLTRSNECEFIMPPHRYARMDWSPYDFVCSSGPRLVDEGRWAVNPRSEGFRDPHVLGSASRIAVGLTRSGKLIFAATRKQIQLGQLARVMMKLGCVEAINLDAGSSLGFYHGGRDYIRPKRKLTNLILIYDDSARYARFKNRLSPNEDVASRR